jgi:putative ABC transport system permease protein
MSAEEARYAALRSFGGVEQVKEECRDAWGVRFIETLLQDLRFGLRMLRKNPGFTAVAVLSLALGIGANTAMFSIIDNLFLRPLPYEASNRLVGVDETKLDGSGSPWGVSVPTFYDWKKQSRVFDELALFLWGWPFTVTGADRAEILTGRVVTDGYFKMLGGKTCEGRLFLPEEYEEGSERVAVFSYGAWQRVFGSVPGVVGKTLTFDGQTHTVVGVMSPDFRPLSGKIDVWMPVQLSDPNRQRRYFGVIGRLKKGIDIQTAQAEMDVIAGRLAKEYPDLAGFGAHVQPLREYLYGRFRGRLLPLFGAVAFVLLIACANVANLMLVRAAARDKEFAIRCAVGGGRARLIRQLLTESMLPAVLGAGLGVLLAYSGVQLMVGLNPDAIPLAEEIAINFRVLGFSLLIALLTGLLFGLAPALGASKPNLNESLKETSRHVTARFGGRRIHSVLMVTEVALSLVLLIGAGLMIHNIWRLLHVNVGFNPENLVTMRIKLPQIPYTVGEYDRTLSPQAELVRKQIRERLQALPGVKAVSVATLPPLWGFRGRTISVGSQPPPRGDDKDATWVCFQPVSPDYFRTLQIPLLKGRGFMERDNQSSPAVAVINETLARRYFPSEDPIGKLVRLGYMANEEPPREIVGVVRDSRQILTRKPYPAVYGPYSQLPPGFKWDEMEERTVISFVVRSSTDPASLAPAMRRIVSEVARDAPVLDIRTIDDLRQETLQWEQFYTWLLAVFAGIAVVLAAVGVFGVTSYSIMRRTHEIGIRMALGGHLSDILKLVLKQGLILSFIGVAIGLVAAFGLTRLLASWLQEVKPTDPLTFAAVSLMLIAVALLACYIPARRATKVDPMVALRYE